MYSVSLDDRVEMLFHDTIGDIRIFTSGTVTDVLGGHKLELLFDDESEPQLRSLLNDVRRPAHRYTAMLTNRIAPSVFPARAQAHDS